MERLILILLGLWRNYNRWNDPDFVTVVASQSVLQVESALREVQRETRQFQLHALRELGVNVPQLVRPVDVYPRSGVDALDVYRRPAREAQAVLDAGGSIDEAWAAFENRLNGIVAADLAIAERDELDVIQERLEEADLVDWLDPGDPILDELPEPDSDDDSDLLPYEDMLELLGLDEDPDVAKYTGDGKKVLGFRRVIRPELSMHGSCGLCVVAATNWYTYERLKPIHHLCKCVTVPVTKDADPGFRWNQEDLRRNLDEIYGGAGGSTYGKDLKRVRVKISEHGELGPVLQWRAKKGWTEANARPHTPRYTRPDASVQRERLERRRDEYLQTIDNLRSRLDAGADRGAIEQAIWTVEQSIRDLDVKLAR